MTATINACAKLVSSAATKDKYKVDLPFFSIQYYGECWAGDAATENKYYLSGSSTECWSGTGGAGVNYVYHFRAQQRKCYFT